ncbi:hypothetical protein B0H14DRAFT_2365065 [Mycena olivaceomarginata]|nr:hypothetical protein B0H14DRAFT_2365065 [Mycena olivaceomarginata]
MAGQATAFRRGARNVRRQMWWRNTKIMVVFLWIFIAQFCGAGLTSAGPRRARRKTPRVVGGFKAVAPYPFRLRSLILLLSSARSRTTARGHGLGNTVSYY